MTLFCWIPINICSGCSADLGLNVIFQMVKPYHGPKNARQVPMPYAFMLFNQTTKNMNVSKHWKSVLNNPYQKFNISDFMTDNKLQGKMCKSAVLREPYYFTQKCDWHNKTKRYCSSRNSRTCLIS